MLFNSIEFFFFFIVVLVLYHNLKHKRQNRLLLLASYVFYGCWDWRFLSLIWISTAVDYLCGIRIHEAKARARRKRYLFLSVCTNLLILGIFKYFNFFSESLIHVAESLNWNYDPLLINVVLPVGISFYTFQSMSYTIDIYRRQLKPTHNFPDFALYVAFFPQLVAGPIERAKRLLPQIEKKRRVTQTQFYEGSWLIAWGLYKKIFIADNLAKIVDTVFSKSGTFSGAEVLLGVYAFAFQVYCDFSGYSNMARGLAKLFGIELMVNFKLPYFVTNPRDFWQHWHISLSTWLRDYLYIPLGGGKGASSLVARNLMLTMLLGGLWHGASWTFVVWGAYHGLLLMGHRLWMSQKTPDFLEQEGIRQVWLILRILVMFHLTCLGWLIFRAESFAQLTTLLSNLFFHFEVGRGLGLGIFVPLVQTVWFLVVVQLMRRIRGDSFRILNYPYVLRIATYVIIFYSIVWYGAVGGKEFIYFQF